MAELPAWVSQYIGLPFVEHGRTRAGVDCWGLIRLVLDERFGVAVPSYVNGYASTTDHEVLGRLIASQMTPWREVPFDKLRMRGDERAGDVALLRVRGQPMHVGLVVAKGCMLHVEEGIATCLERYDGPRWARRLLGIFRHESMPGAG